MRSAVVLGLVILAGSQVFAQFPQSQRARERMDQSIRASEDREHDRRLEESDRLPVPRAAVMNVDVQIALTRTEFKTFGEAKAAEAKKIVDGEPLWLHIKFKSKLGDYVLTTRHPDDREKLQYTLFAEIAPRGDISALQQYTIRFAKEDLLLNEVKIALAPALFGRNKSIPVFLMTSGSAKAGVWNNEFRLTNNVAVPRALTDNLASAAITLDFSGGLAKYRKMESEYDSIVLRGSTDVSKMPVGGTFFSEVLSGQITAQLATEGIKPIKIYFSGDDWQEFASFAPAMKKFRRIFATFTYRLDEKCFYGVAGATQNLDFMTGKYLEPEIQIQKDLAVPCAEF